MTVVSVGKACRETSRCPWGARSLTWTQRRWSPIVNQPLSPTLSCDWCSGCGAVFWLAVCTINQGIRFLIDSGLLKNTSDDIAQFLYKGEGLNKTAIGDYLGERWETGGGVSNIEWGREREIDGWPLKWVNAFSTQWYWFGPSSLDRHTHWPQKGGQY